MTLVMKFGGTSVGSAAAIKRTAGLIIDSKREWQQVVAVASAMSGVTDLLLRGADSALVGDSAGDQVTFHTIADLLRDKHHAALNELIGPGPAQAALAGAIDDFIAHFVSLCEAVQVLGEITPRALDTISSMGERMSVRLLAAYLEQQGHPATAIDATRLIVTDDNFQAATPLLAPTITQTRAVLQPLLDSGRIPIVTGFMGATAQGITTTLGRGGSDFSAALLGQALPAKAVWIWTDVDGVMTTDPRLVSTARSIPTLSYREVAELAYYGAKVLHPKTIRPVVENNIPLRIKNTFNPGHAGTLIVPDGQNGAGTIKAVTAIKNLCLVTVEGKGMIGVPGIAARTFGAVARNQVSVLLITQASSEQSICFAAPDDASEKLIGTLEAEFAPELGRRDIDRVWAHRPVAIVTVVGAGMRGTPGIAGRIFSILGQNSVNIIAIAQGSSECSISLVVAGADVAAAVNHVHSLIVAA